ncbi:MAG: metal-dependent hydrolase [Halioglobus sp.]|nr:metal-dependent hydrolase [Halioglobus sp.]
MTAASAATATAGVRAEATIKPRQMRFDMSQLRTKYFFRDNPILSTLMYALSASFPDGERFFIDTVRHYQKDIDDPVLLAQIRGFIGQEAHHSRIHEDFNAQAASLGMAMEKVQRRFKRRIETAKRNLDPGRQLAITAALEHITATLAQWTLENPEAGVGGESHSPLREMLVWHAMEEIEHKAVAFDVYRAAVNKEKQRIVVAKIIFRTFWVQMAIAQLMLLWHDRKIPSLRHIREAWNFMWGKGGFRSWSAPEFKRYLKPGFHPDDINQSHLIEQWQDTYPEVAALQVG